MAKYTSQNLRNLVLCGHTGSGKTMLVEAMLLKAGVINRLGQIAEGTTVSDFEPEEKEQQCSLTSSLMHFSFADKEVNVIDTPGAMDFIGATISGIAGADLSVICINANKGVEVMARKAWELAGEIGLGRMIVITRMDGENVNYAELLDSIKKIFSDKCVAFTVPDGEGSAFKGVTRVLAEGATGEGVDDLRVRITEAAVECDDALMEKYLEGEEISPEQVRSLLQQAVGAGKIVPVFCLAAEPDLGVEELLQGIAAWGPSPLQARRSLLSTNAEADKNKDEEEDEEGEGEKKEEEKRIPLPPDSDGLLAAQVFKVISDPHVGKMCYFRLFSGALAAKANAFVSATGKQEKFNQLLRSQGEKREEVTEAITGDIVAVSKVENLRVGDTIYDKKLIGRLPPLPFPEPMAGLAVAPKKRGDEQKLSENFHRLCEEDQTFRFERNAQTNEQVIRGIGLMHLDVMLRRLKRRYNLEVSTKAPKIPYLETITKQAEGSYRHKKQTGGAGQFGEVYLRLKPNQRGAGFEFVNSIVGGAISQPFIPSVQKGVKAAMVKGTVAGYPVVDIIVELFDGKEHPVDSKDIAFQMAGRNGFNEVIKNCHPILLEPIVNMEIVFPAHATGDISSDISSRRGRPTGMDQMGDLQLLKAQAPLAEVADYGSALKAITQGEGFYSMEISHYDPVPGNLVAQVVAKTKAQEKATA